MKKILCKTITLLCCSMLLLSCHHTPSQKDNTVIKHKVKLTDMNGLVLNVPKGAELELALLALDEKNSPKELLAVERFQGKGDTLSFQLNFDINRVKQFKAVELRGRVSQNKQLIGYVSPWHKKQLQKQDLNGIILEFAQ